MDSKLCCVAGAVIRPLGIDVTVDKDDLIEMSRDKFHQACGHQWGGVLDATAMNLGHNVFGKSSHAFIVQRKNAE